MNMRRKVLPGGAIALLDLTGREYCLAILPLDSLKYKCKLFESVPKDLTMTSESKLLFLVTFDD